jgi:hypothetical protein
MRWGVWWYRGNPPFFDGKEFALFIDAPHGSAWREETGFR